MSECVSGGETGVDVMEAAVMRSVVGRASLSLFLSTHTAVTKAGLKRA